MNCVNIIFPNQLFENSPLPLSTSTSYIIEDELFFKQYNFHKQKIALHRSSMKFYEWHLKANNLQAKYISHNDILADIDSLFNQFKSEQIDCVCYINPVDNFLSKKIEKSASKHNIN